MTRKEMVLAAGAVAAVGIFGWLAAKGHLQAEMPDLSEEHDDDDLAKDLVAWGIFHGVVAYGALATPDLVKQARALLR